MSERFGAHAPRELLDVLASLTEDQLQALLQFLLAFGAQGCADAE